MMNRASELGWSAYVTFSLAMLAWLALGQHFAHAEPSDGGAEIYRHQCASCHGAQGEGVTDVYEEPLFGKLSLDALTELIERTMPEDEPELCQGDDARRVAAYIFGEFYSLEARERNGLSIGPRIELLRLTVPQYRNVVADLLGSFTTHSASESRQREEGNGDQAPIPGLIAEYFQSKGMSKADSKRLERVDRRMEFDFGTAGPTDEITADQFAIVWTGALRTEETGNYEFRVTTQNGARLYLNMDPTRSRHKLRDDSSVAGNRATVDAWVSSGKLRDESARVFLLGGRTYPIRFEFFKYKEESASVRLEWRPPNGVWEVLDGQHLSTDDVPRTFVVETPFPADDRSWGYERGSSVSEEWQSAVADGAIATTEEVIRRLPILAGIGDEKEDRADVLLEFAKQFAARAFRRPLTEAEIRMLESAPFRDADDPEAGLRRSLLYVLTSPHFLYVDLPSSEPPLHPDRVAARLALALWDSLPDARLRQAATEGRLASNQDVENQARRMLQDDRAKEKMRQFFHHWLEIGERDLAKDVALYPDFDEAVIVDLRRSLEQFVDHVVWSPASDYRQLLLADYLYLNDRLARLYDSNDVPGEDDSATESTSPDEFRKVSFSPERRVGVLTHPYLLSAFAYHNNTSPIHRGVFLTRNIVGRGLKPPPIAVAFKNEEFSPDLTMREKVTQLTRDQACMACHSLINPLGFALEHYDAVGRWRTAENDKPIDSQATYRTSDGEELQIASARDIASFAVESPSAHRAFVTQLFQHVVKQDPDAFGRHTVQQLCDEFVADEYNIQNLLIRIALIAAVEVETDEELVGDNP